MNYGFDPYVFKKDETIGFGKALSTSTFNNWAQPLTDNSSWPFGTKARFPSLAVFTSYQDQIPEGCLCLIDGVDVPDKFKFFDYYYIRTLLYNDYYYQLFMYKRKGFNVDIKVPRILFNDNVESFSIAFMCTNDMPYVGQLIAAVEYYNDLIMKTDIKADINVAFFGEGIPSEVKSICNYKLFPSDDFHIAYARNRSVDMCKKQHIFITDIDKLFSYDSIRQIVEYYHTLPHQGMLNIRQSRLDPSNLFGNRLIFESTGGYWDLFRAGYCEDDEMLIELARQGIMPVVVHVPYVHEKHPTSVRTTDVTYNENRIILRKILLDGRGYIYQ